MDIDRTNRYILGPFGEEEAASSELEFGRGRHDELLRVQPDPKVEDRPWNYACKHTGVGALIIEPHFYILIYIYMCIYDM